MEEAIGEESNSWASVDNGENIVELEWSFSWSMMGLQIATKKLAYILRLNSNILDIEFNCFETINVFFFLIKKQLMFLIYYICRYNYMFEFKLKR